MRLHNGEFITQQNDSVNLLRIRLCRWSILDRTNRKVLWVAKLLGSLAKSVGTCSYALDRRKWMSMKNYQSRTQMTPQMHFTSYYHYLCGWKITFENKFIHQTLGHYLILPSVFPLNNYIFTLEKRQPERTTIINRNETN